ncbi:protein mono-ADP-ribosyltransferase PARP12 isoform X2 [Esox lucius]|uniref:protein mono-ADP-ribosyltransferase PARP12 isoform X2 n=1 Tax=Esox lucius TaxID=8010 RepID=UPI001477115B|nr:protein mono-ADP-ribosyltransferase PARP12 isoform X2 [Esox lucius]
MVTDMDNIALIYKVLSAHNGSFELGELRANIGRVEDDLKCVLGNPEMFTSTVYKGKQMIVAKTKMRLCQAKGCNDCSNLHVCKFFLYGTCPSNERQGCFLSHELTSEHNRRVLGEHHLEELDRRELCTLLLQNDDRLLPPVCFIYNKGGGRYGYCPDKDSCTRLHICQRYISGICAAEVDCDKSHDFYEPQPLNTLQNRGVPNELVASMLPTYRNIQAIGDTKYCKNNSVGQLLQSKAFPGHWDKCSVPETGFKRVALQRSSDEYKKILDLFHQTMPGFNVKSIERVQNRILWDIFQWQEDVMRGKNAGTENERHLFYGTDSKHVDDICLQNVDWRMERRHGMPYGKGGYFSKDASNSHSYTSQSGVRSMFVCRVMVGIYTQGHPSSIQPLLKVSYDSYVDHVSNPSIFVVVNKHQVYPEYLIQYREGSRPLTYGPALSSNPNQTQYIHWQPTPVMLQSQATPGQPKNTRFIYPHPRFVQRESTLSTQPQTLLSHHSNPAGLPAHPSMQNPAGKRTQRPTLRHASAQFGSMNSLTQTSFQPGLRIYTPHQAFFPMTSAACPPRRSQFAGMKAKSKSMASLDNP